MRLEGRTAFVTGGASGIGAATVRRLASEGARVVVTDIDGVGAKILADEVNGIAVELDVTDPRAIDDAVRQAASGAGPVDVLVNNAGGDRMGFFHETDRVQWNHVLELNLTSAMALTQAILPAMVERRTGAIVNVASEAGRSGTIAGAAYAAAKAGLIGFTKAIALESVRSGVRCNAVAPGPIDTQMLNGSAADYGDKGARILQMMVRSTPMQRLGTPDEVAATIVFLASDDASYMTGQTLAVSGGLSMW